MDSIDSKPCTVTLQILNVIGFETAMYKFYFIDFENRNTIPKEFIPFFSKWDLYYKLENNLDNKKNNIDKVLKDNGFIIIEE